MNDLASSSPAMFVSTSPSKTKARPLPSACRSASATYADLEAGIIDSAEMSRDSSNGGSGMLTPEARNRMGSNGSGNGIEGSGSITATAPGTATAAILARARASAAGREYVGRDGNGGRGSSNGGGGVSGSDTLFGNSTGHTAPSMPTRPAPGRTFGSSNSGITSPPARPASASGSASITSLSPPSTHAYEPRSPNSTINGSATPTGPSASGTSGFPFKPQPTRHRSGSSVSITSLGNINLNNISTLGKTNLSNLSNLATGAVGAVGQADREAFFAAADKATTWLSGWAPKGEGRSREFLKGTWEGIGSVAGAVGGAVGDLSRRGQMGEGGSGGGSDLGSPEERVGDGQAQGQGQGLRGEGGRVFGLARGDSGEGRSTGMQRTASTPMHLAAPVPLGHANSSPAVPSASGNEAAQGGSGGRVFGATPPPAPAVGGRRILQPANLSRLGRNSSIGAQSDANGGAPFQTLPVGTGMGGGTGTPVQPSLSASTSSLSLSTEIPRVMSTSPTPTASRPKERLPIPPRRSSAQDPDTAVGSSSAPLATRARAHSRPGMPPSASTSALAPRAHATPGGTLGGSIGMGGASSMSGSGSNSALSLSASPGNGQYMTTAAAAGPHGSSHLNPNAANGSSTTEGDSVTRGSGRYRHGHSNSYSGIATGVPLPGAAGQRRAPSFGAANLLGPAAQASAGGPGLGLVPTAPGMSTSSSGTSPNVHAGGMMRHTSSSSYTAGTLASNADPNGTISRSGSMSLSTSRPSFSTTQRPSGSTSSGLPRATTSTSISALASAGTPYKIGFQPAGVKGDRTAEFAAARKGLGEGREREEGRLGRRWAKLVDLHFNPNTQMPTMRRSDSSSSIDSASTAATNPVNGGAASPSRAATSSQRPAPVPLPRSSSSRRSLMSMENLSLRPNAVWKGLKAAAATPQQAEETRKRVEEQGIVKWEEDGATKRCRICQALFSLSNRKHHCRLCGRLVCSLPPTNPALLAVQMQLFPPAATTPSTDTNADTASLAASISSVRSTDSTTPTDPALPAGTRREKCSILLVADYKSGRGEEVEEGFVGWMKLDEQSSSTTGGVEGGQGRAVSGTHKRTLSRASSVAGSDSTRNTGTGRIRGDAGAASGQVTPTDQRGGPSPAQGQSSVPLPQQPREVQVKGVRACRECWAVVSRKQKMQDRQRVPGFARLYAALRTLQSEIEEVMLDFEGHMDLLRSHDTPPDPPPALLRVHKHLLELFASFEILSKRVSSMPAKDGGSQSIVQAAVARSAAVFLAKEMAKVQALPRLQKMIAAEKRKSMRIVETTLSDHLAPGDVAIQEDLQKEKANRDLAMMLQPLLEQEAQLEQYIADANAQRKYDDGRALSEALGEIKAEIGRVMAGAV